MQAEPKITLCAMAPALSYLFSIASVCMSLNGYLLSYLYAEKLTIDHFVEGSIYVFPEIMLIFTLTTMAKALRDHLRTEESKSASKEPKPIQMDTRMAGLMYCRLIIIVVVAILTLACVNTVVVAAVVKEPVSISQFGYGLLITVPEIFAITLMVATAVWIYRCRQRYLDDLTTDNEIESTELLSRRANDA